MGEIFKRLALIGDVWVLWILAGASIASWGVMIERWRTFRRSRNGFEPFLEGLVKELEAGDFSAACRRARAHSSVESRVVLAGLSNYAKGSMAAEESMTAKLVIERAYLEKNLVILGTLGNNAPFIGLFGTVLGIIRAFNDLAVSGNAGVSVVMSGVSSALIATAFGIFVAIPAVAANNYFHARLRGITANCQSLIHIMKIHLGKEVRVHAVLSRGGEPVLS